MGLQEPREAKRKIGTIDMKPNSFFLLAFFLIANYASGKQYVYLETKLGGCYEPVPTAFYVEVPDSIDPYFLLENDSLLVDFLNQHEKIYVSWDLLFLLRDTNLSEEDVTQLQTAYDQHRSTYHFSRKEHWDHFSIQIAVVEHPEIQQSTLKWAHPKNAASYTYLNDAIHIFVEMQTDFTCALSFE